jgi:hypothetical protein
VHRLQLPPAGDGDVGARHGQDGVTDDVATIAGRRDDLEGVGRGRRRPDALRQLRLEGLAPAAVPVDELADGEGVGAAVAQLLVERPRELPADQEPRHHRADRDRHGDGDRRQQGEPRPQRQPGEAAAERPWPAHGSRST